jgi:hypothetical protein
LYDKYTQLPGNSQMPGKAHGFPGRFAKRSVGGRRLGVPWGRPASLGGLKELGVFFLNLPKDIDFSIDFLPCSLTKANNCCIG